MYLVYSDIINLKGCTFVGLCENVQNCRSNVHDRKRPFMGEKEDIQRSYTEFCIQSYVYAETLPLATAFDYLCFLVHVFLFDLYFIITPLYFRTLTDHMPWLVMPLIHPHVGF